MKFGVVADFNKAELLKKLGFDYIEGHVTAVAKMSDEEFASVCDMLARIGFPCDACCVLFPGSIKVTGPEVDEAKIAEYIDGVFPRLKKLGVKAVVFGSGGARRVPEGFDRAFAWHQLVRVGRLLAEKAEKHGLVIALEPLNTGETNIINSQLEGLRLVEDVDRPAFRILSDFYHLWLAGEDRAEVAACGDLLVHTHIAYPKGRFCMKHTDDVSYAGFFSGLRDCGYDGCLSIEGKWSDDDLAEGLEVLRGF